MPADGVPPIRVRGEGSVEVVARWDLADGAELRLVRFALRGNARRLVQWARGQNDAPISRELGELEWLAGVALEERESPAARWQSIRRQEFETDDLAAAEPRLRGWEAGLIAHAEKRARRRDEKRGS